MRRNRFRLTAMGLLMSLFVSGAGSADLPAAYEIEDIAWVPQTWNNCGPATLAMGLDRWGITATQGDIASLIRPNSRDGHVSIDQIRFAAAAWGLESFYAPSADIETVKRFVARGFPVMMPTWHIDDDGEQMGHYRLVHGYDEAAGMFAVRDSLEPVGHRMDIRSFDLLWRVFNRRMLVLYPPDRSDEVRPIADALGTGRDMLEASLETARSERLPVGDLPFGMSEVQYRAYGDFNRSMALTSLGRHEEAAEALRGALGDLPWRMLWYQPEVLESMDRVNAHRWIAAETSRALAPYPYLEELWYWRGRAEAALGNVDSAETAFLRALEIRPGWDLALSELAALARSGFDSESTSP